MPIYTLPNGKKYNIPEDKVNTFLNKFPEAKIDSLGKITPPQEDQMGALAEVNVAPTNMDLSLEIPSLGSQEKDTAIERAFGKNSLTDFFGDIYRAANKGLEQSSLVDPSINLYREGAEADDETILNFIKANEETNKNIMQSDEMREFNKIYEEEGGGWWGFIKGAALNPTVLTQELVSSIAMQIGALKSDEVAIAATAGLGAGALAGAPFALVGAVPGGIAGAMGGAMAALETGLTFSELLNKELGDNLTVENVRAFLQNEEKLSDLKNKALGRGLTIGAIELATMGIAKGVGSKIAKAGFKRAGVAAAGAIGGIEIAGGATGEIAGRFVAGQEMDAAEIGFEAFAGLGSAPISILGQSKNISKSITRLKIDKELKNTNYNNASDLFINEEKTSDAAINLAKIKNAETIVSEEINNRAKKGEITKEQAEKAKENLASTTFFNNILEDVNVPEANKAEVIDLLKEQNALRNKIKKVNNPSLTKRDSKRLEELDNRIDQIITEKKLEQSIQFAEKGAKKLGLKVQSLNKKEIAKKYKGSKKLNDYLESDGFIENGVITINTDTAKETRAVTVGSHELLHGILNKELKGKDRKKIVAEFKNIISKDQLAIIEERLFAKNDKGERLYSDEYLENEGIDEYFTAFSDAILLGDIKYNENIFTKLGDFIRPILRKFGFSKIKFDSGRDVYNFLKEYNKSVKKGELSKELSGIQAAIESDVAQFSKSKASDRVQQIYEAQGAANALDIIDEFKPIVDRIVNKYRNVPGFEYQLLKDEIETGKRGILDMIMSYTPEKAKGAPLAGYINSLLPKRAIEAAQRVLGTEFTVDVTEAKGVTDTVTEDVLEAAEETNVADEIKSLRKEIGLPEELVTKVKKAVIKTFGTKLPSPEDPKFKLELQKAFRTELKKPIAKFVGRQEDYELFLRDNFKAIYDKLPQSLINRRFKDFAEPVLDESGKQMRERTAEGKKIFTKKKLTTAEFIKYFLGSDVGRSTQGTRKTAIVEAVAEEIAFDATMEVLQDPDVLSRYEEIAGITEITLPENFKALIAKQIDRSEGLQFSKSLANEAKLEYNLERPDLVKLLETTDSNKLRKNYPLIMDSIMHEYDDNTVQFSLTTKAEGKWIQEPLNPLDESSKLYKFKVGEVDYEIKTFKDPAAFDYSVFEQTEGIGLREVIDNDPKSWAMTFADALDGSTDITGVAVGGLTNQFKVFGTVANATIDLIKSQKLNSITFTAKEKSRKRLYRSLNEKFAKDLGWDTYDYEIRTPDGEETVFIAYNPKFTENRNIDSNPASVQFSNTPSANDILNNTEKWKKYQKEELNNAKIFQEKVGNIKARSGSFWPSWILNTSIIPGFDELKKKDSKKSKNVEKRINDFRKKIINTKIKNKTSIREKYNVFFYRPNKAYGTNYTEFIKLLKSGQIFKLQQAYLNIYDDMWGAYFDLLKENPNIYDFLERTLQTSNNEVGHWHRLGAEFIGIDPEAIEDFVLDKNGKKIKIYRTDKDGNIKQYFKKQTYEFEHAVQNHIVWKKLLNLAKDLSKKENGKQLFMEEVQKAKENYKLFALSVSDARKVDKAGYGQKMPKDWKTFLDRYFNTKVAAIDNGIDPGKIVFIEYKNGKAEINGNIKDAFNIKDNEGKTQFSRSLNKEFNKLLEQSSGIRATKQFSPIEARILGKGKGRNKFFIPYSADDFVGLLYATLAGGKTGDQQMEWYRENLLRPFSRGIQQYEAAKQNALREWQILKKEAKKNVPGGLTKKNATGLTNQDAVRIYIWNQQGMEIPDTKGSQALINENIKIVRKNKELKAFAERLMALQPEGYPEPSKNWDSGDITTDIVSYINGVKRSEFLTEWKNNVDIIFSDKNKEKLRALYGDRYVEALNDMLDRMRTGTNRKFGISRIEQQFMDWTNNSVGAIMFFNARSAVLQTLSAVNFINFTDNNPLNAALALANQPQYWKDFATLFNSDFLKQRRSGLQTDVNADEIARAAKGAENTARAALSAILKFGFTPTQIADSFAIASGGATFYRNRINKYLKEGLSQQEAEQKAFTDFQEIAEETQQSARPDRISSQQASSLGRLILAFGNTPMQYARLTKKATLDLINGRGDWKTNISKIMYYSVIQNIIFSALQQGLFALLFDDEDDDKEKSRLFRIGNSSLDTLLRGVGVYGAAAATVKNMILEIIDQQKSGRPDYTEVVISATAISPPINSKLRKLNSAGKTFTYKQSKEKVFTEGFSLENPAFLAGGQIISAATNLPADRVVLKADHIKTAMQSETELWQAIALSLGWSEWDLNMIEKQTKKSKKFDPRNTNRNINRGLKRKKVKR